MSPQGGLICLQYQGVKARALYMLDKLIPGLSPSQSTLCSLPYTAIRYVAMGIQRAA